MNKKIAVLCFVVTVLLSFFLFRNFTTAFPTIEIEITEDRKAIKRSAEMLLSDVSMCSYAQTKEKGNYSEATIFYTDEESINYVELSTRERGSEMLKNMIRDKVFNFYQWATRVFQEENKCETWLYFPSELKKDEHGNVEILGFENVLSEEYQNENIEEEEAIEFATIYMTESANSAFFSFDINDYTFLSYSSEVQPISNRLDHEIIYKKKIIYELKDEGRIELHVTICGNEICKFLEIMKIPEKFQKEYQNMRSYNETMALFAEILLFLSLVVIVLVCTITLNKLKFFRVYYLKKMMIVAALLSLFMNLILTLNKMPSKMVYYDTSYSSTLVYQAEIILGALTNSIIMFLVYFIALVVAEALMRQNFPSHVQLTKVFASCKRHPGKWLYSCIIVYTMIVLMLSYVTAVYKYTKKIGWWVPSTILINPNYFSHYIPWLSSVIISVLAGLIEETIFRAIILCGAYALSSKVKKFKNGIIVIGFAFQMFVFSAAHCNYASLPFYARLLELLLPSLMFGLLFVKFGFIVPVFVHYGYDLFWFGLSIVLSKSRYVTIYRVILGGFMFFPIPVLLVLLLMKRRKKKKKKKKVKSLLNGDWKEYFLGEGEKTTKKENRVTRVGLENYSVIVLSFAALLLFAVWYHMVYFKQTSHESVVSKREDVIFFGEQELTTRFASENEFSDFVFTMRMESGTTRRHQESVYIMEEYGDNYFTELIEDQYLDPVYFHVRYFKYGSLEEYHFKVFDGEVKSTLHIIPEHFEGKNLTREEAREISVRFLEKKLDKEEYELNEITAKERKKPFRTDWDFSFQIVKNGEEFRQATVEINGNEVVGIYKHVKVPETYSREKNKMKAVYSVFKRLVKILSILKIIVIGVFVVVKILQKKYLKQFWTYGIPILSFILVVENILNYPQAQFGFSPAKPKFNQIFQWVSIAGIFGIIQILQFCGVGSVANRLRATKQFVRPKLVIVGLVSALMYYITSPSVVQNLIIYIQEKFGVLPSVSILSVPRVTSSIMDNMSSYVPVVSIGFYYVVDMWERTNLKKLEIGLIADKIPLIYSIVSSLLETIQFTEFEENKDYFKIIFIVVLIRTFSSWCTYVIFERKDLDHIGYRFLFLLLLKITCLTREKIFNFSPLDYVVLVVLVLFSFFTFEKMLHELKNQQEENSVEEEKKDQ